MLDLVKKRIGIVKQLYPHMIGVRRFLVGKVVSNLLSTQTALITPIFFKVLVDDVMLHKQINKLYIVILGYLAVFLFNFFLSFIETYTGNRFYNRFLFNIRFTLWNKYMKMPIKKYEEYTPSDMKMRIDDNTVQIQNFIDSQTFSLVISIITFIANGVIMIILSWKLAVFAAIMVPVTFYIGYFLGKGEKELNVKRYNNFVKKDDQLLNSIQGWKEVKALTIEKQEERKFCKSFHDIGILEAKWIMYWLLNALIMPAIKDDLLMKFFLYLLGGVFTIHGDMTVGSLLIFVNYYSNFYNATNTINSANIDLNNSLPIIQKVIELLCLKNEAHKKVKLKSAGNIKLRNVSFAYSKELGNVLEDICFNINVGQTIAIVGKSGTGKSTLIKLILNVISPDSGEILFDGNSIDSINPVSLHKNIGVVMQDSYLFNMSIAENLKLAKYNATKEELIKACKYANIYDLIKSLPDGFDTLIGERGIKLSGGQRQRIAIARVFLSNPRIIIFDEATSALDNESERLINDAMEKLSKNKTVIIVAHRLSSIIKSDKVIVLKDKNIVGFGHHTELLGNNETYDELFKGQYIS